MLSYSQVKPSIFTTEHPELRVGATGAAVAELQKLLAHWGTYRGEINGQFNRFVEAAVKRFQFAVFLKDDGIVGPLTWEALETGAPVKMPLLRFGSSGPSVKVVQTVLSEAGFYPGEIDGIFGPITQAAVRLFQKSFKLIQDGMVSQQTWWALSRVPRSYIPGNLGF